MKQPPKPETWWERARAVMDLRGMEVPALTKAMGLPRTHEPQVRKWLDGAVRPRFDVVLKLADVLDVSLDWLAGRIPGADEGWKEGDLERVAASLSPDAQKVVGALWDAKAARFLAAQVDQYRAIGQPRAR